MAVLRIARMGHPVLMAPAQEVADPTSPAVRQLLDDMVETMADAEGIGLAAPQVHVPARIVVFFVPSDRMADCETGEFADGVPLTALINPVIEPLSDEMEVGVEGCLSLPGMQGMVPRHTYIRYSAIGPNGQPFTREAHGYHARVVQHECDHLDGLLYPMRMTDLSSFGFVEDMRRGMRAEADAREVSE